MASKQIQNGGRTEITIDWDLVDQLLQYHCTGQMIAGRLGIHPDTLYDRTVKKFDKSWSDYSAEKQSKGKSRLLQKQFERALSEDKPSDNMLIWLGKQALNQKDKSPEEIAQGGIVFNVTNAPYLKDSK